MRLKAGNDDYAAMEEGVFRRYTGSLKDLPLPDLLLIDGGVGQVRAAARALERAGLRLPLVGLAKGRRSWSRRKGGSSASPSPTRPCSFSSTSGTRPTKTASATTGSGGARSFSGSSRASPGSGRKGGGSSWSATGG